LVFVKDDEGADKDDAGKTSGVQTALFI